MMSEYWAEYRDEEHAKFFTDKEWAKYKEMFMRGPNFPDWLKKHYEK